MYNKIQAYKQMGYSIGKIAREIDTDRKTVGKYWDMEAREKTRYFRKCYSKIYKSGFAV